jgi:hypothetical protein
MSYLPNILNVCDKEEGYNGFDVHFLKFYPGNLYG